QGARDGGPVLSRAGTDAAPHEAGRDVRALRDGAVTMSIRLSLGMSMNPRTRPVFQGRAKADGIDLQPTQVHVAELFWRQLKNAEFDVSEMSMSSLLMSVANGDKRFIGLPIFTTRRMFHTNIWVRKDSGIDKPADLKGKKIGVPEYQQTSALWTRGVLQHD